MRHDPMRIVHAAKQRAGFVNGTGIVILQVAASPVIESHLSQSGDIGHVAATRAAFRTLERLHHFIIQRVTLKP